MIPQKTVLFACVENSCRSQMAEAFARILGRGVVDAHSGGSRPSGAVSPKAIASMREAGIDLSVHRSKSFQDVPAIEYDVLVTMGCGDGCPSVRAKKRIDWNIPDPKALDEDAFAAVRDLIRHEVEQLIHGLAAS